MHVEGLPLISLEDKVWLTVFKNDGVWVIVYGQVNFFFKKKSKKCRRNGKNVTIKVSYDIIHR